MFNDLDVVMQSSIENNWLDNDRDFEVKKPAEKKSQNVMRNYF